MSLGALRGLLFGNFSLRAWTVQADFLSSCRGGSRCHQSVTCRRSGPGPAVTGRAGRPSTVALTFSFFLSQLSFPSEAVLVGTADATNFPGAGRAAGAHAETRLKTRLISGRPTGLCSPAPAWPVGEGAVESQEQTVEDPVPASHSVALSADGVASV